MIPSAVFVTAVAQQNKIPLSNKCSRNLRNIPNTYAVYTCFVHLGKLYDRVPLDKLWGVFRECGVPFHLLLAVKYLYSCSQSVLLSVELNHNRSPW